MTTTIANPHLWNGRVDPYLYTADVTVSRGGVVSRRATPRPSASAPSPSTRRTASRSTARYLDLHGPNRHQDRLDKGWAIGNAEHDQDMALITEMGSTAVRTAHYQHAQYFYDLCDQNGIVAWAEIPLVNNVTTSTAFDNNAKQQLDGADSPELQPPVDRLLEPLERAQPVARSEPAAHDAAATSRRPRTRAAPTTLASNRGDDRPHQRPHATSWRSTSTGGWYSGTYDDFAPWADAVHAAYPTRKIGIAEYGAGAGPSIHSETPVIAGPQRGVPAALPRDATGRPMDARPWLWGKFIWNMFDFAVDSRNEGETPGRNDKGLVTYDRALEEGRLLLLQGQLVERARSSTSRAGASRRARRPRSPSRSTRTPTTSR